jgi:hypothetical protein
LFLRFFCVGSLYAKMQVTVSNRLVVETTKSSSLTGVVPPPYF